jgi:prevent-host-death family protein
MHGKVREVPASEFKAHCLQLMDQVEQTRAEIVVTKHGRPVARLVPIDEAAAEPFGFLAGTVQASDDLVAPIEDSWEADA